MYFTKNKSLLYEKFFLGFKKSRVCICLYSIIKKIKEMTRFFGSSNFFFPSIQCRFHDSNMSFPLNGLDGHVLGHPQKALYFCDFFILWVMLIDMWLKTIVNKLFLKNFNIILVENIKKIVKKLINFFLIKSF